MSPLPVTDRPFTPQHRDRIAALWREGLNTYEIARKLGLDEAAVAGAVRRERERRMGIGRVAS